MSAVNKLEEKIKDKFSKIKLDDYTSTQNDSDTETHKNRKTATHKDIRTEKPKKIKCTFYIEEASWEKFNELHYQKMVAKDKTDKSDLISQAIELLLEKEGYHNKKEDA